MDFKLIAIIAFVKLCWADTVPVLMWGNFRLSFPQSSVGDILDAGEFFAGYVSKAQDDTKYLVTFLQNKLSLDDLTIHGDAYEDFSEGGAFHNLKNLLDTESSSAQLANVREPMSVLSSTGSSAGGDRVQHHLASPYDLSSLDLDPNAKHHIIVDLPAIPHASQVGGVRKAYAHSDAVIGSVTHQLKQLPHPYTAVYTAAPDSESHNPSESVNSVYHHGAKRTLLEAESEPELYTLFNYTCVWLYAESVWFAEIRGQSETKVTLPPVVETSKNCKTENTTLIIDKTYDNLRGTNLTEFHMKLIYTNASKSYGWILSTANITYAFQGLSRKTVQLKTPKADPTSYWAPQGYSYTCCDPIPMSDANATVQLGFTNVQMQMATSSSEVLTVFGQANDCVGFFSINIFAGLIGSLVLVIILAFGVMMISNIQTMDRFDDPKGKTISVNTSD